MASYCVTIAGSESSQTSRNLWYPYHVPSSPWLSLLLPCLSLGKKIISARPRIKIYLVPTLSAGQISYLAVLLGLRAKFLMNSQHFDKNSSLGIISWRLTKSYLSRLVREVDERVIEE